ncbi:MAG: DUF6514 family protein [Cellulosilyticaceae bacterium]
MQVYKRLLGQNTLENKVIKYYVVQKHEYYGIELEEQTEGQIVCENEYFTETFEKAFHLAKLMKEGMVSLISMAEIIDDYIQ